MYKLTNQAERAAYRANIIEATGGTATEYAGGELTILRYQSRANRATPCVYAWRGTAGKPYAHYSFRSEADREKWIEREITSAEIRQERKAKRAEEKKAAPKYTPDPTKPMFEVGRRYAYGWSNDGYDYTHVIEVVARSACYVTYADVYGDRVEAKTHRAKISADRRGEYISPDFGYYEAWDALPTAEEQAKLDAEREAKEAEEQEARYQAERARADKELEIISEATAHHPYTEGTPAVAVEWIEDFPDVENALKTRGPMSIAAAEIIFSQFDEMRQKGQGYDKLKFHISGKTQDGEAIDLTDRYDLGDHDGGLIAHIRMYSGKLADDLARYTAEGLVTIDEAIITQFSELKKQQEEAKRREQEAKDEQATAELAAELDMMTAEQIEMGIDIAMQIDDKEAREAIVKFMLQSLMRQNKKADAFRIWNKYKDELTA